MKFLINHSRIGKKRGEDRVSCSVKLDAPIYPKTKRTKKYINDVVYKLKLGIAGIVFNYQLKNKSMELLNLAINICGTGLVIWYCIEKRNFLSYGMTSALILYYSKYFVDLVKKPYKEEK